LQDVAKLPTQSLVAKLLFHYLTLLSVAKQEFSNEHKNFNASSETLYSNAGSETPASLLDSANKKLKTTQNLSP